MFRRFREDVAVVSYVGHYRHFQLFADGVDRRIRHLREQLVEIVEQDARPPGKRRQRGVVAHCPYGLAAGFRHRAQNQVDVLRRPAESPHSVLQSAGVHYRRDDSGEQAHDGNVVFLYPAPVRTSARVSGLDFSVLHQAMALKIEP